MDRAAYIGPSLGYPESISSHRQVCIGRVRVRYSALSFLRGNLGIFPAQLLFCGHDLLCVKGWSIHSYFGKPALTLSWQNFIRVVRLPHCNYLAPRPTQPAFPAWLGPTVSFRLGLYNFCCNPQLLSN